MGLTLAGADRRRLLAPAACATLRDPQSTLAPLALGAGGRGDLHDRLRRRPVPARRRRTRSAGCWSSRRSPRSSSTRCSRSRSTALVRRWLTPVAARGPAAPPAAGLHDRRPLAAAEGVTRGRVLHTRGPPPADHAAARAARRRPRLHRARAVRDHLLPPLVPAGPRRRPVPRRGQPEPRPRRARSRRRAATSSTATATTIVDSRLANVVQINPRSLPDAERAAAADLGPGGDDARRARGWPRTRARWRAKHPQGDAAAAADARRAAARSTRRFAVDRPRHRHAPETIQKRVIRSLAVLPYAAITLRIDVPRSMLDFLEERKALVPGDRADTHLPAPTTRSSDARRPAAGQRRRGLARPAQGAALPRRAPGDDRRQERRRVRLRPLPARPRRRAPAAGRRAGQLRRRARRARAASPIAGPPDQALARPRPAGGGPERAPARGRPGQRQRPPGPGRRVRRDEPVERRDLRDGLRAVVRPDDLHQADLRSRSTRSSTPRRTARRCSTARCRACIRRARRSSRSPRWRRCSARRRSRRPTRSPTTAASRSASQERCNAGKARLRHGRPAQRAEGLLRRLLLHARSAPRTRPAPRSSRTWRATSGSAGGPASTCPASTPGIVPDWRWRQRVAKREAACRRKKHIPLGPQLLASTRRPRAGLWHLRHARVVGGRQRQPRRRPGRRAGLAAADGGRLLGDRHGRPRAAPAPRPRGRGLHGPPRPAHPAGPGAPDQDRPRRRARRCSTACTLAASAPGGTSTDVWTGWNPHEPPARSTARPAPRRPSTTACEYDQSWYVCWIKDVARPNDPGIVIAVTVEKGGFGAEAAAPAARLIASKWFGVRRQDRLRESRGPDERHDPDRRPDPARGRPVDAPRRPAVRPRAAARRARHLRARR